MRVLSSLRWSLFSLAAVGVLATLVVSLHGAWVEGKLTSNAAQVFVAKDLVADILPPPMFLVEMRLVLSQAVEGSITPAEASQQLTRLTGEYQARATHWKTHPPHGLESKLLGKQHEAGQRFIEMAQSAVIAKLQAGDADGARQGLAKAHAVYLEHRAGVDETVQAATAFATLSTDAFESTKTWAGRVVIGIAALAVALVVLLGRGVLRNIESAIHRCTELARRIAKGDLTRRGSSDLPRTDAIGALESALLDTRRQLAQTVGSVRSNAEAVACASSQIAQGNLDLSQRTELQAGALQQTSSNMAQLDSAGRSNLDSAAQANALARAASEVATRGGHVMSQAVQTMKGISDSSRKIADIISVIDGIAFQTNILALNAAVEAARAGEQGRGFAVVASEVRSLAGRSAEAAREIKRLITASVEQVESGTDLVNQAGSTMGDVVVSIQRVTDIMSEIGASSSEQRAGVQRVGTAVGHMDQSTQQNAALVEEMAAAAESLKGQAHQLVQAMQVFKLSPDGAGATG